MCHRRARTHRGPVLLMPDDGRASGWGPRLGGAEARAAPEPPAGAVPCPSPRPGDVALRCAATLAAFERWVRLVDEDHSDGGGAPRRGDDALEEVEGARAEWEAGLEWLELAPSPTPADADAKVAAAEALAAHSDWEELRYVALLARAASEALRLHRAATSIGDRSPGPVVASACSVGSVPRLG